MLSFYQLLELEESTWRKRLKSTNPHLASWKDKIITASARRKAYMKSKQPYDQQLYKKSFASAQHSKQRARGVMEEKNFMFSFYKVIEMLNQLDEFKLGSKDAERVRELKKKTQDPHKVKQLAVQLRRYRERQSYNSPKI